MPESELFEKLTMAADHLRSDIMVEMKSPTDFECKLHIMLVTKISFFMQTYLSHYYDL